MLFRSERDLHLAIKDQLNLDGWSVGFLVDLRDSAKVVCWKIAEALAANGDVSFIQDRGCCLSHLRSHR